MTTTRKASRLVVGLTGPNAAGKGEVARFLGDRGLAFHSLSDIIREEAAAGGLSPTRENLIETGNALRRRHGAGVLAERTLERLTGRDVVDSIRNPAEVEVLRREPAFLLLAVDAPIGLRYERARLRSRAGDGSTLEEFTARERLELGSDPVQQQIHLTIQMADLSVDNSGTLSDLHRAVIAALGDRL